MSKPKNQNAAHVVSPECTLSMRCVCADRARWKAAAKHHGAKTMSAWVVATLNDAAAKLSPDRFNETYPIGTLFAFNGRKVRTTCEAFERNDNALVCVEGRESGVLLTELTP